MIKSLRALCFLVFAASAAAAAQPQPAAERAVSIVPPAGVANAPSNRLTHELSTGGKVVILLRPDAAPAHVERVQADDRVRLDGIEHARAPRHRTRYSGVR